MSNRDGTGPLGQGPRTGRGLGYATQEYNSSNTQEYNSSSTGNILLLIATAGVIGYLLIK